MADGFDWGKAPAPTVRGAPRQAPTEQFRWETAPPPILPSTGRTPRGDEDIPLPTPQPPPPPLTSEETVKDIVNAGATGVARGFLGIPGLPGSVAQLYDIAPISAGYYWRRATGASKDEAQRAYDEAMAKLRSTQTPGEQAGLERRVFGVPLPTSEGFLQSVAPGLHYEAQSAPGRVAGVVGEFIGGAPGTAPVKALRAVSGAPRAAATFARTETVPAIGAGLASGVAGEQTRGSEYEGLARVAGALAGQAGTAGTVARFSPGSQQEAATRLAGDIARGQLAEQPSRWERTARTIAGRQPRAVREAIEGLEVPPGQLAPGVSLTPAELLPNEPGIRGLESRTPVPGIPTAEAQRAASRDALMREAGQLPSIAAENRIAPTMSEVLGLPVGHNPMAVSSTAARNVFDELENAAYKAKETAWKHPVIQQARYQSKPVLDAIDKAIEKMGGASYENMRVELRRFIEALPSYGANGIPLTELQKIKESANSAIRDKNTIDITGAKEITTVLDDVMTNIDNVMPRFMSGTTYTEAAPVWDAARKATRSYYDNFGNVFIQSLAERHPRGTPQAGQPIIPPEQMLDHVLGNPKDALAKYKQLAAIPGIDKASLDNSVGDWIVGRLTDNGTKINITPNDINRFVRSPGNATLVERIPGLQERLQNIASQSVTDRVIGAFDRVTQNPSPQVLSTFIKNNRDQINEVFRTPEQQQYISRLEKSADALQELSRGTFTPNKLENFLQNGDLFSVLHGWQTGLMGRMVAGAAAGKALGMAAPWGAGLEAIGAGIGAGLGAFTGFKGPTTMLSNLAFGPIQQEAAAILQRATTDPRLMQELLRKPTIQDIFNPLSVNGWAHGLTGPIPTGAAAAARAEGQSRPYEGTTEAELPPTIVTAPRIGRASGGRLTRGKHAAKAAVLIRAAEQAKKQHNGSTKTILEQPDEVVAKALSVANSAI